MVGIAGFSNRRASRIPGLGCRDFRKVGAQSGTVKATPVLGFGIHASVLKSCPVADPYPKLPVG